MGYSVVEKNGYWILKSDNEEIGYLQDPAITEKHGYVIEKGNIAENGYKGKLNGSSLTLSEDSFPEEGVYEYMVFEEKKEEEYIGEVFIEEGENKYEVSRYNKMNYSLKTDLNSFRIRNQIKIKPNKPAVGYQSNPYQSAASYQSAGAGKPAGGYQSDSYGPPSGAGHGAQIGFNKKVATKFSKNKDIFSMFEPNAKKPQEVKDAKVQTSPQKIILSAEKGIIDLVKKCADDLEKFKNKVDSTINIEKPEWSSAKTKSENLSGVKNVLAGMLEKVGSVISPIDNQRLEGSLKNVDSVYETRSMESFKNFKEIYEKYKKFLDDYIRVQDADITAQQECASAMSDLKYNLGTLYGQKLSDKKISRGKLEGIKEELEILGEYVDSASKSEDLEKFKAQHEKYEQCLREYDTGKAIECINSIKKICIDRITFIKDNYVKLLKDCDHLYSNVASEIKEIGFDCSKVEKTDNKLGALLELIKVFREKLDFEEVNEKELQEFGGFASNYKKYLDSRDFEKARAEYEGFKAMCDKLNFQNVILNKVKFVVKRNKRDTSNEWYFIDTGSKNGGMSKYKVFIVRKDGDKVIWEGDIKISDNESLSEELTYATRGCYFNVKKTADNDICIPVNITKFKVLVTTDDEGEKVEKEQNDSPLEGKDLKAIQPSNLGKLGFSEDKNSEEDIKPEPVKEPAKAPAEAPAEEPEPEKPEVNTASVTDNTNESKQPELSKKNAKKIESDEDGKKRLEKLISRYNNFREAHNIFIKNGGGEEEIAKIDEKIDSDVWTRDALEFEQLLKTPFLDWIRFLSVLSGFLPNDKKNTYAGEAKELIQEVNDMDNVGRRSSEEEYQNQRSEIMNKCDFLSKKILKYLENVQARLNSNFKKMNKDVQKSKDEQQEETKMDLKKYLGYKKNDDGTLENETISEKAFPKVKEAFRKAVTCIVKDGKEVQGTVDLEGIANTAFDGVKGNCYKVIANLLRDSNLAKWSGVDKGGETSENEKKARAAMGVLFIGMAYLPGGSESILNACDGLKAGGLKDNGGSNDFIKHGSAVRKFIKKEALKTTGEKLVKKLKSGTAKDDFRYFIQSGSATFIMNKFKTVSTLDMAKAKLYKEKGQVKEKLSGLKKKMGRFFSSKRGSKNEA